MAEVIQFSCPACNVGLRLPLAMAGARGPCPSCGLEIIAPDPERRLDAREPTPTPPPAAPEPALPPEVPTPEPLPKHETAEVQRPPQPRSQRWILFALSILLTAAASLASGYLLGVRSRPPITASPPVEVIPVIPQPPPLRPVVEPEPEPEATPAPEVKPAPVKASATAEAALKAFLEAPDWSTRAAHVLSPDIIRPAMETYSHTVLDGPTPYQSISIQNSHTDRQTGSTLFIYQVVTPTHPTGIPVAVAETDSGWLVDWQTFIEFRDNHFKSFVDGPVDKTGRFHLITTLPPAPRAANTENEHFSAFLLDPPFPGHQQIAYVRKTAAIHPTLVAATEDGALFTPVLELVKRKTPDGKTYLEITNIIAHDWLPQGR